MNAVMRDWQNTLRDSTGRATRPETILVALEDSNDSRIAVPVARVLARLEGATLHFLCVTEHPVEARDLLKHLALSTEDVQGFVLDQISRNPEAITNAAQHVATPLVLVSARPLADDTDSPLGALCEAVLSAPLTQVVVVPPECSERSWGVRRVLLCHDGTPTADLAISTAAHLARRADAEVIALHVAARKAPRASEVGSFPAPRYVDQPQHEWPAWANEFVQRMMALGASPAAVNFKLLVTGGQPGSEIAQFAQDNNADLVVMAWRGRWEPEHAATLKVVIRRSACPVFLISLPQPSELVP